MNTIVIPKRLNEIYTEITKEGGLVHRCRLWYNKHKKGKVQIKSTELKELEALLNEAQGLDYTDSIGRYGSTDPEYSRQVLALRVFLNQYFSQFGSKNGDNRLYYLLDRYPALSLLMSHRVLIGHLFLKYLVYVKFDYATLTYTVSEFVHNKEAAPVATNSATSTVETTEKAEGLQWADM